MDLIADILLGAGAFGAAIYCYVLSRRLKKFNQLEGGMGEAIATLSVQVDDMTKALTAAQTTANGSAEQLKALTERAEKGAEKLEIMLASLHDLPAEVETDGKRQRVVRRRTRTHEMESAE
ncbi:hypothetical protein BFP70_06210 [Thioclava sp. SK-1]|uniref:hypothetical protein n=1 Tax=Thioclava sp. SK-1 TaxID=1889770 RepID=UPI0008249472|nr:hypothetical protein [Thioclava sp. SK-1]OCX65737.1 hypothetical protein BFP70_06210 [Thioclava sp. SK-1]